MSRWGVVAIVLVIVGILGSAVLAATVFGSPNQPIVPSVPTACILVSQSNIRDKTGNSNLAPVGEATWNANGGSKCTWQSPGQPDTAWSFELDPELDPAKKLRADEGYSLASATSKQLDGKPSDHVYILSKGNQTYGLLYDNYNVVITVIGPAGSPLGNVYQLMLSVLNGYIAQMAAGAGGQ